MIILVMIEIKKVKIKQLIIKLKFNLIKWTKF